MSDTRGFAGMRRAGLLALALGFALLAVGPAVSLTEIPAQLERDRVMQELMETPADHKGGGWTTGEYERDLRYATMRLAGIGDTLMLSGMLLLAGGSWFARAEPGARRMLHATLGTVGVLAAMGFLGVVARRMDGSPTSPIGTFDLVHALAIGLAFAFLAASRGSRLALGLGIAAAAAGLLKQLLLLDQMTWNSSLARHAYVTIPLMLWLGWTLTAAAFAAAAAPPDEPKAQRGLPPPPNVPTHTQ